MLPLIIILAVLVVLSVAARWLRLHMDGEKNTDEIAEKVETVVDESHCTGCAAADTDCYATRMLKNRDFTEIEYFEDEELDAFAHRAADSYDENEISAFREVLTTMQTNEITDWLHSLQLREIELPAVLRDEVVMLLEN